MAGKTSRWTIVSHDPLIVHDGLGNVVKTYSKDGNIFGMEGENPRLIIQADTRIKNMDLSALRSEAVKQGHR